MNYNENELREDLIKIYGSNSVQVATFDMLLKTYDSSESKLIEACRYGYDFHKTSQFPDFEFDESAVLGNFKQKLLSESDLIKDILESNLDNDDLKSK